MESQTSLPPQLLLQGLLLRAERPLGQSVGLDAGATKCFERVRALGYENDLSESDQDLRAAGARERTQRVHSCDALVRQQDARHRPVAGIVRRGLDRVQAPSSASADELKALCKAAPNVQAHLDGKEIVKEIVVPGKLVNLVVR